MNARIARLALAAVLLFVPAHVHAQAQDSTPQMVPAEFVELLWGQGAFGGRMELLVGRLPDQLAAALDPGPEVRVVGSTTNRMFTIAAVIVPGGREAAREALDAKLLAAGWTVREDRARPPRGGFEQESSPYQPSAAYCSADDRQLGFTTRRHRGDSTAVVFMLSGEAGMGSPCAPDLPSSGMTRQMDSPVPTLRAPEDAVQRSSGGGGVRDEWNSHTRLRTELTPGALIGHYAPQFVEQGWLPVTQTLGDDVAIHVFSRTDDEGVAWHAVLNVTLLPDGERDLYLRVTAVNR